MRADAGAGGTLSLESDATLGTGVRHVFVLRVEGGRGAYAYRPALGPGEQATGVIPSMDGSRPLAEFTEVIADDLAAKLTESGLYAKEARAMVNTWKTSYFQNDGIRVLFVLPQSWTDAFIPIRIAPKPREVVRVMVGRLELLSPERERRAEAAVRDLASGDPARRQEAFAFLREQGRYVEPIVRRVAATTRDDGVRTLCRRLLLTGFVTDLRAAIHNAADGKRLDADPLELRAHLARLYREMGMTEEARAEATVVWQELQEPHHAGRTPSRRTTRSCSSAGPPCTRPSAKIGGPPRSMPAGSSSTSGRCRATSIPASFAWLRERWDGRAYAECLVRAGLADSTIAALQQKLDRLPSRDGRLGERRTTCVLLAFLLEARGQHGQANVQWTWLESKPALALASV